MFNIFDFERSLKISWLHKVLFSEPDWKEFALCFKIERLPWTGLKYHTFLLKKTNNPFWTSVISAYMNWYTSAKLSLIKSPFLSLYGAIHRSIFLSVHFCLKTTSSLFEIYIMKQATHLPNRKWKPEWASQ